MSRPAPTVRLFAALVLAGLLGAPAAEATWPGSNGSIYFVCRATGAPFDSEDICAINADGSGFVNLTNTPGERESTPSVSPDGRQIAFIRGSGDTARLWAMSSDGSGARQLTDIRSDGPNWTPDGQRIAFRAYVDPAFEFRLVAASGGASTPFALPAGSPAVTGTHQSPRYAADGRYLYTRFATIPGSSPPSSTEQAFVVANGAETRATPFEDDSSNSFPSWSPDGGRVLYNRLVGGEFEIFSVASTGGDTEVKLTDTPTLSETWGSISPDGTKLLYQRDDAGFNSEVLVVANADGGSPAPIPTPGLAAARMAVWSPTATSATPISTPDPTPKPDLTVKAPKKLASGKALTLKLSCKGPTACVITYGASVSIPASVLASKTFRIKSKKTRVASGKTKKVKLKLGGKARKAVRKALKKGLKPKLKVVVTARQPSGKKIETTRLSVKLKP